MNIQIESLRKQIKQVLLKNMTEDQASKVTDYFVWAEASGNKT